MALQFKRGTNLDRQLIVLAEGEPFYVTDFATYGVSPLYIGDGVTTGGIATDINNIDELFDVVVTSPQNNQVLQWNTANGRWQNETNIITAGSVSVTTTLGVTGLTTTNGISNTGTVNSSSVVTTGDITVGNDLNVLGSSNVKDLYVLADDNNNFIQFGNGSAGNINQLRMFGLNNSLYFTHDDANNLVTIRFAEANRLQFNTSNQWFNSGKLGVGTASPTATIDGYDASQAQLKLATPTHVGLMTNDETLELFSLYYDGNRMQFSATDQWFNTGRLGVNTSTPAYTLDVNGDANISSNLIVGGNLTVNGTTTTVNSNEVNIGDAIIVLNADETGTPSLNAGIEIERGTEANAFWQWNETYDWWEAGGAGQNIWAAGEIIAGTELATNGRHLYMNNGDVTPSGNYDLTVRRNGLGDATIRWNETTDKWEFSNDGTTFVPMLGSGGDAEFGATTVTSLDVTDGTLVVGQDTVTNTISEIQLVNDTNTAYITNNDITNTFTISAHGQSISTDGGNWVVTDRLSINGATASHNLTVNGDAQVTSLDVSDTILINNVVKHDFYTLTTTSTTSDQQVFNVAATTKTVKATIQLQRGSDYHALEVLMLANGTTAYMTQYAEIYTNTSLATFSVDYTTGMRLLVTPTSATSTIIEVATVEFTA